jgi:DnaJ-class molecular chaperone
MEDDYYKILGLDRNASDADIQKAYRTLARRHHPDVNPDDKAAKEKFQRIQTAYEVLKDPEKREMYDRYGSAFESMQAGGPGGGPWRTQGAGPGGFDEFDFSQLFGSRFGPQPSGSESPFADIFRHFGGGGEAGQRRSARRPARGANLRHDLTIPFNTAVTGGEARLTVKRPSGNVETISVKVPAGIEDGKRIRLRGQGGSPAGGGPPGDILLTIHVEPHPCFRRRGNDLEVDVPVSLAEAALGAKVDVPTPKGVITLTVPPGTSSGKRLRIKGHGVSGGDGKAGDLYAEILIALPDSMTEDDAELIRQFDGRHTFNPRSELKW